MSLKKDVGGGELEVEVEPGVLFNELEISHDSPNNVDEAPRDEKKPFSFIEAVLRKPPPEAALIEQVANLQFCWHSLLAVMQSAYIDDVATRLKRTQQRKWPNPRSRTSASTVPIYKCTATVSPVLT